MKTIYYKIVIVLLSIAAAFIATNDYTSYLNILALNKSIECYQSTSNSIKVLSYSPTIKNLVEYDGLDIIKIENSKENEDFTTVQIEYKGEIKTANDILNSISKDSKIMSIKNISINNENNETKITADIDYLSNIICK